MGWQGWGWRDGTDQTADFSVCLSPFRRLNSRDPDTLPLSPWKHLDRPPILVQKTTKNNTLGKHVFFQYVVSNVCFQYVDHELGIPENKKTNKQKKSLD